MAQSEAKVRTAPDSAWRPPRIRRALTAPRHLLGLGLSLLVGALILAVTAFALPAPAQRAATASAVDVSRTALHRATPAHAGGRPTSTVSSPAAGTKAAAPAHAKKPSNSSSSSSSAPTSTPAKTVISTTISIKIQYGDTLWALAGRHGTTVEALQRLNGLGASTLIYAGRQLLVPSEHEVGPAPGSAPASSPTTPTLQGAAAAVAYAKAQIGKPYLWGGTGPYAFDCSGLVLRAWQAGGVNLPRTTYEQANAGRRISRDQLVPGDLVLSNGFGHVQLYIGGGEVIEAPHTGATVWSGPLPPAYLVDAYVRVASATPIPASHSAAPTAHPRSPR